MGEKLEVVASRESDGCVLQVWVRDPGLVGKRAHLVVSQRAKVKRSSPVHREKTLFEHDLVLGHGQNRVELGGRLDGRETVQRVLGKSFVVHHELRPSGLAPSELAPSTN